jgi:hypothetical protein
MAVLPNLVPGTRRGGSCACPGAASRVAALGFLLGRRLYASSRVRLTGDRELYSGWRGGVLSARVPTVSGVVLQCLGWRYSDGDGRTGLEVAEVMEKTRSASLTSRRCPGLAPGWWPCTFRGCCCPISRGAMWRKYGSGWHSVTERHWSSRTTPAQRRGWPHSGGLVEQHWDVIPRRVSEDRRGGDSLLTRAPVVCQSIYSPGRRSRPGAAGRGSP